MARLTRNSTGRRGSQEEDANASSSSEESDWTDLGRPNNGESSSSRKESSNLDENGQQNGGQSSSAGQSWSVMDNPENSDPINHFLVYTAAMFTLPFLTYFVFKIAFCEGYLSWPAGDCLVPSAIAATCVVLIICALFVRDALRDNLNDFTDAQGVIRDAPQQQHVKTE